MCRFRAKAKGNDNLKTPFRSILRKNILPLVKENVSLHSVFKRTEAEKNNIIYNP